MRMSQGAFNDVLFILTVSQDGWRNCSKRYSYRGIKNVRQMQPMTSPSLPSPLLPQLRSHRSLPSQNKDVCVGNLTCASYEGISKGCHHDEEGSDHKMRLILLRKGSVDCDYQSLLLRKEPEVEFGKAGYLLTEKKISLLRKIWPSLGQLHGREH